MGLFTSSPEIAYLLPWKKFVTSAPGARGVGMALALRHPHLAWGSTVAARRGLGFVARLCVYLLALAFVVFPPAGKTGAERTDPGIAAFRIAEEPPPPAPPAPSASFSLVTIALAGVLLAGIVGEVATRRRAWR